MDQIDIIQNINIFFFKELGSVVSLDNLLFTIFTAKTKASIQGL